MSFKFTKYCEGFLFNIFSARLKQLSKYWILLFSSQMTEKNNNPNPKQTCFPVSGSKDNELVSNLNGTDIS